jgi:hypothetical protein
MPWAAFRFIFSSVQFILKHSKRLGTLCFESGPLGSLKPKTIEYFSASQLAFATLKHKTKFERIIFHSNWISVLNPWQGSAGNNFDPTFGQVLDRLEQPNTCLRAEKRSKNRVVG